MTKIDLRDMDDVFDDNYDEREFMKREADLVKERFQTVDMFSSITFRWESKKASSRKRTSTTRP